MQKNNHYLLKFKNSMFWNSLDSVTAQALVTIHHILLQALAGAEFHGLFAAYISIMYTAIPFFNFGFDYSLSPYLKDFIQTKKNFLSLVFLQFLPQLAGTCLLAHFISQPFFYSIFSSSIITAQIASWLKYLFIVEYIRKSIRSFLQLIFYTRITATVEIGGIVLYMLAFWIFAWLSCVIPSLVVAVKFLTLTALIQTVILCVPILKFFLTLNSTSSDLTDLRLTIAHRGINKTRFGIWANHIFSQINYSNFVVPFATSSFGPAQGSILAILMNSARCIKLFFQKGLGVSSLALLSQPQDPHTPSQKIAYSYPIYYLYNLAAPLLIFFLINATKLSYLFSDNQIVWHLFSCACLLSVIEGAISVYEKFYIAEKRIYFFSIINSIGSIILFALSYQFLIFNSLSQFFLFFFLIRTSALISIICLSHYFFRFSSMPTFNRPVLLVAIVLSVLFYLLF